ncbi:hypothetical protein [Hymenobacter cellulosilyticus]|uniref:DUF4199 domain-containing protein n=1 Tax=Hymenobacter cellulosilyticus TaxID=2932248 RepID=A0A8T9QGS9_9BACT|nr:hypothetical protein [Hymenobacter cellulosilyticus]UOQ74013.1 hypothetical protein MUN79_09025 [Hymenobacter cellulosilyticus]
MPQRLLFLLTFFLVTTFPPWLAQAQSARKSAKDVPAVVLTRKDTAYAVHELFVQRRTGGALLSTFGIAMTGIYTVAWIQTPPSGTGNTLLAAGIVGMVGVLPAWLGINKHRRYNLSREQIVLTDYAKTGTLAKKYRRHLRGISRPVPGNKTWPAIIVDTLTAGTVAPVVAASASGTSPDSATGAAPAARPAVAGYTMADSLDAVAGLFASRRLGGEIPLLAVLPAARLMTGSSGKDYNMYTGQFEDKSASAGP